MKIRVIEKKGREPGERRRVAAYVRVSRAFARPEHSLRAQADYYRERIRACQEWEYAGIYEDFGISGAAVRGRDGFGRLLEDCEAGRIDLVLTKSISRFARNTVDLLSTVRRLRELGVGVWFEREKIDSLSGDGELMLSLLASFAQEESRSLSENIKWGIRERYQSGDIRVKNKRVLGYRCVGEKYEILPGEAEIVRRIFARFLSGAPVGEIRRELNEAGAVTWRGCGFSGSGLRYILQNELYVGDRRYQKCYVQDPVSRRRLPNRGNLPQYYVRDDHAPIVSREDFARAQERFGKELSETGDPGRGIWQKM